jgi:alkanesulfonate monooxygenase SsuD/methylene tetrahydromethanopterin reductase-like flavin-dependent oxidoreductase (luciferase family)
LGDGYFPSSTDPHRLTHLLELMRTAGDQAGRDPSAIELTVAVSETDPDTLSTHIEALLPLGIDRVLLTPCHPRHSPTSWTRSPNVSTSINLHPPTGGLLVSVVTLPCRASGVLSSGRTDLGQSASVR